MVYAYIRVSAEKQTETNQHFEIAQFYEREGLTVDAWITETVSGTANPDKRKLGELLNRAAVGVKLGRPKGALGKNTRLSPYESTIRVLIEKDNTTPPSPAFFTSTAPQ